MIQTEIRFARSEDEVRIAKTVAAKSFYPDVNDIAKHKALENKWASDPFLSKEFLMLALSGSEIVGGLRTTPLTISRASQEFSCLGIAELFVSPNFQGLGIASQLVDQIISTTKNSKYELILGVSRKKIDGFYLKKGFYGVGSYPECRITDIRESIKFRTLKSDLFHFRPIAIDQSMNSFYEACYKNQFGRRVRSKADWERIGIENQLQDRLCLGIYLVGELVGYLICREKVIQEISFRENLNLVNLIYGLSEYLQVNELKIEVSSSHLLLRNDLGFDITVSTRECFYGGHIALITNLESIIHKFFDREYETLSRSGEKVIQLIIGSESFQLDLAKKTIKKISSHSSSKLLSYNAVEIDYVGYEMTRFLLGSKTRILKFGGKEFDFSSEPFHISYIDEF